VNIIDKHI